MKDEQPDVMKLLDMTRMPPLSVSSHRLTRREIQRLRSLAQTNKNCYNATDSHDTLAPSPNSVQSNGGCTLMTPLASPFSNPAKATGSYRQQQQVPIRADTREPLQFVVQKMSHLTSKKGHTEKPLQTHLNPSMDFLRRMQWMQIVANYHHHHHHHHHQQQQQQKDPAHRICFCRKSLSFPRLHCICDGIIDALPFR